MLLTTEELMRYSRHLNLPDFGPDTQETLKKGRVLVIGAGGLGAPLLQYLTASGVGAIGLVDYDTVDESNLQRQVLFDVEDVGKSKVETAIKKLSRQNPHVKFIPHQLKLDASNALDIIQQYDVVADGSDNFPTRYLVNDACILADKPLVHASIYQFEGQVSVFHYTDKLGTTGPNYRDLFPSPPPPGMVPSCAEGGVLGVLPGIIGSIQASEVIKVLTGLGNPLSGRLFLFDALEFSTRTLNIRKNPENPLTGRNPSIRELIDYEAFCGNDLTTSGKSISVEDLKAWMESGASFELIDVREPYEYEAGNLGGTSIPLSRLDQHFDKIPKDKKVVVHCKSGVRSAKAIETLQSRHEYHNLWNLTGGILAWKEAFDPKLTVV